MGDGKLIVRGAPEDLVAEVEGKVWTMRVDDDDVVDGMKETLPILSTRRLRGSTVVSILSDGSPGAGWEQRETLLEDAYFAYLNGLMIQEVRHAA